MDARPRTAVSQGAAAPPGTGNGTRRLQSLAQSAGLWRTMGLVGPIVFGLLLGTVVVLSSQLPPTRWGMLILAVLAPTIAALTRDLRKLVLILFVVAIPLNFDISLAHRPEHRGGPGGVVISLMSLALLLGYAHWLARGSAKTGGLRRPEAGIVVPALAFTLATIVSAWQATEVWYSLTQILLQVQFLLMFLYLSIQVRSWSDVRLVTTTLALCVAFVSLLIFAQFAFGFGFSTLGIRTSSAVSGIPGIPARPGGTFAGPNQAATFLAAGAILLLAGYLTDGRIVNKRLALFSFSTGVAALVLTQSRSAWIAFAVGFLILTTQAMARQVVAKRVLSILALFALLVLAAAPVITLRFASEDRGSGTSRILHSQMAIGIIQDHMFDGVGVSQQRFAIDSGKYSPPALRGKEEEVAAIHNTYLATWVETGVFGFLAFVWLLLGAEQAALRGATRARDPYVSIVLASLGAALVIPTIHMLTATFTGGRMQILWLLFGIISSTVQVAKGSEQMPDPLPPANQRRGL